MNLEEKIKERLSKIGVPLHNKRKNQPFNKIKNHYASLLFNLLPDVDPFFSIRNRLIDFGYTGRNTRIRTGFRCSNPENIYFLDDVFLNYSCTILAKEPVLIGTRTAIGPNVGIYTVDHKLDHINLRFKSESSPVLIGDYAWIGAGATILPGVRIGNRSIVGAGAVVTEDIEDGWLYCGIPAKRIKKVN